MTKGRFIKNSRYYTGVVYEWNLPTGTTCPYAKECKVSVSRASGKFEVAGGSFLCYAAFPERFPGVREHRWKNFDLVRIGGIPDIPKDCKAIRIHAAGDFFNQKYFDMWMQLARDNPYIEMWAYTKSLQFWVNRLGEIPADMIITASYGGKQDHLIEEYNLKNVIVYPSKKDVPPDRPIDKNDDWARIPGTNFALVDNMKGAKTKVIEGLILKGRESSGNVIAGIIIKK